LKFIHQPTCFIDSFFFSSDVPELAKLQECIKSTLQIAEQWKLVEKDESDPEDI